MYIVLISDIHANLPALEAAARDIACQRPDAVYVLGDMVNGCAWPAEVLDFIAGRGWPSLMGNHDDAVLQLGTPRMEPRYAVRDRYASLWWTRARLRPAQLAALADLPLELAPELPGLPRLRLLHGTPGNFFVGFQPNATDGWAAQRLIPVAEPVVAGGHTHVAMIRQIERWLVVNSGSVGMPYDGDCRPSYAWLRSENGAWQAGVRRIDYDLAAAERGFAASGLLAEAGVIAEMTRRSVVTGLPWIADFAWWMRSKSDDALVDMWAALARYDAVYGPHHWSFPYA